MVWYVLTRICLIRYFDPHPPCEMADFGVHLAPIWWGRISGPKRGYFQAVSGLFLATSDFIIFGGIFENNPTSSPGLFGPAIWTLIHHVK